MAKAPVKSVAKAPPIPVDPNRVSVIQADLVQELEQSYGDYAMSVIVARALPDVRDGLKPVHRRILWAMDESGYSHDKPYRKSARIVGEVMGKYHPHGDSAIYDTMVRLAQYFSMSLPLVDGQGNFGSVDGDPAAAMRYTESRLASPARLLLEDIDRGTVDFQPNYDEQFKEPVVLPARFPNLLVNGGEGIAVGIATKIPPHDLGEIVRAALLLQKKPDATIEDLMEIVPGPDFPTAGIVLAAEGLKDYLSTGKGTFLLRARHHVEEGRRGRRSLVFTELPFQVNKARLAESIGDLIKDKKLEGLADVRDESDRDGMRFVVEIAPTADPDRLVKALFRLTQLQISFSPQMYALHQGRPKMLSLKEILAAFLAFRRQVVRRRTVFDLRRCRDKAHIVLGRLIAVSMIDKVVATIRASKDSAEALERLLLLPFPRAAVGEIYELLGGQPGTKPTAKTLHLTEIQAQSILDLRLHRLTGLERTRLEEEGRRLAAEIARHLEILREPKSLEKVVSDELRAVIDSTPTKRRTEIRLLSAAESDDAAPRGKAASVLALLDDAKAEDLSPETRIRVVFTEDGRIRRFQEPEAGTRKPKKAKEGKEGRNTPSPARWSIPLSSKDALLAFSKSGQSWRIEAAAVPEDEPEGLGRAVQSVVPCGLDPIVALIPLPSDADAAELSLVFVTDKGSMRRNAMADFLRVPSQGRPAMKTEGTGEVLFDVLPVGSEQTLLLQTRAGMALRFPVSDLRIFAGRDAVGVRSMKIKDDDALLTVMVLPASPWSQDQVSAHLGEPSPVVLSDDERAAMSACEVFVAQITSAGLVKKTSAYQYRPAGRGGQGVRDLSPAKKAGALVAAVLADSGELLRLRLASGATKDLDPSSFPILARAATGTKAQDLDAADVPAFGWTVPKEG